MTKLLRVSEAAALVGLHRQTLSRAADRGTLPYTEEYGLRLFRPADVKRYAKTRQRGRPKKRKAKQ